VINSLDDLPVNGEFNILAPIWDGSNAIYSDRIRLALNPQLSVPEVDFLIDRSHDIEWKSTYQQSAAWTISYQLIGNDGLATTNLIQSFGRTGSSSGVISNLLDSSGLIDLSNLSRVGTIKFFLTDQNGDNPVELKLSKISANEFSLSRGKDVIASLTRLPHSEDLISLLPAKPLESSTYRGDLVGYTLPSNQSWGQHYGTVLCEVKGRLMSEAANNNRVGFVLVNNETGHIVDPLTGMAYDTSATSGSALTEKINSFYDIHSLFEANLVNNKVVDYSFNFEFSNNLSPDMYTLMPYLESTNGSDSKIFTAGIFHEHSKIHASVIAGRAIGFEDQVLLGDSDFDDAVAIVDKISFSQILA
jgi:hypothetical protein